MLEADLTVARFLEAPSYPGLTPNSSNLCKSVQSVAKSVSSVARVCRKNCGRQSVACLNLCYLWQL
jgi:hypothetical protein